MCELDAGFFALHASVTGSPWSQFTQVRGGRGLHSKRVLCMFGNSGKNSDQIHTCTSEQERTGPHAGNHGSTYGNPASKDQFAFREIAL